jgi:hypothetical protein
MDSAFGEKERKCRLDSFLFPWRSIIFWISDGIDEEGLKPRSRSKGEILRWKHRRQRLSILGNVVPFTHIEIDRLEQWVISDNAY